MFKFNKYLAVIGFSILLAQSCSQGPLGGNLAKNNEKFDKIYGVCDNPHRHYTAAEKIICEDKERAAGADGELAESLNLTKMFDFYRSGGNPTMVQGMTVNPFLWSASLDLLSEYPLDIVETNGGFISTEWIYDKNTPAQRCMIKVVITSIELISTGVDVNLLCESKENDIWYQDDIEYTNDEKNLTLKILEIANQLSLTEQLS